MRKLAIIDKNKNAHLSQWKAAPDPKKFFSTDNAVMSSLDAYNPDIVFINKGNMFTGILPVIKKYKSVYFYGDYYTPIPAYVYKYAKICTAVIFTNKDQGLWKSIRTQCDQKNIFFVPLGTDTDIFKPLKTIDKIYDIVFGGNYLGPSFCGSKLRLDLVEHLLEKGYNLQVVGNGWPAHINAKPFQSHPELNFTINQAKLTVGISHFINVPYYTSNRLFQFMATGVPHITWYSPKVKDLFLFGYKDVNSYEELDKTIDDLFNNNSYRIYLGNEQLWEIRDRHTIYNAWDKIEKIMENI